MAKGGKRPGAGRKPRTALPFAAKTQASRVLDRLGGDYKGKHLPSEDDLWLTLIICQDLRIRMDALKYLSDRRDGKAVQTINHLHDKPIEMNVKVSLGERMKSAMEKAEQRLKRSE